MLSTSDTQTLSQATVQQYGSAAQIAAAAGLHVGSSRSPVVQVECMQEHGLSSQ